MEKDELIKLILSDKDLTRRAKEWISTREEIQQESLAAASYNPVGLETFLTSMPNDEFDQMIQSLCIGRVLSRVQPASHENTGLPSVSNRDVPMELNDNGADAMPIPQVVTSSSEMTPEGPKIKEFYTSSSTLAQTEDSPSVHHAVFDIFEEEENDSKVPLASNWNFPLAPKPNGQNIATGDESNPLAHESPNKNSKPGEVDPSSAHSVSQNRNSSHQYSASILSDSEEHDSESEQADLRQSSLETSDQSPASSSDESFSVRTPSRTSTEEPTSDRAIEHDGNVLPGNHNQRVHSGSNINHHHSLGPGHEDPENARGFPRLPGQDPVQTPAADGQAAAQPAVNQDQNLNLQLQQVLLGLRNPSQIPSETLHTIVMMLERELRRNNQLTRCDSCANLQAEIRNLRKSCRCLGQQLELLKWNYILLEEFVKNLEEELKQKENDNKDSLKIIHYFHKKLVERKNEILKLKKEMDVMKNKFEEERKMLYEKAEEESKSQTEVCEQMKKHTKMLERVTERVITERQEKNVLQKELKQKSDESSDLLKENQSLKNENKELKQKMETQEGLIKQLMLNVQSLEAEREKAKETYQHLQDEYICREAQFNDRIQAEIKELKELFENLRLLGERHGFSRSLAGLNWEKENEENFPSP